MTYKTAYYGIDIVQEGNSWWIVDDLGNETYYDHYPTKKEIDCYRDEFNGYY